VPEFSMSAGDFISIYSHSKEKESWDGVVSCFFLDACPDVVETLEVIHRMLKPGGCLINLGPLLYHWSGPPLRPDDTTFTDYKQRYCNLDERYFTSVDLSYQDIKTVMMNIGFDIVEERTDVECLYTSDERSMMNRSYKCVCFVAKKKMMK
jgi:carnosine N-methyltransferase